VSLTGNLEDLPLLDIIQIVCFSKKTGYLTIRRDHGDAAIVFNDGRVVASFTPDSPPPDPRAATLHPDKRSRLIRNRIEIALEQLIRLRDGQFSFSLTDAPPLRLGERDLTHETLEEGINAQALLLDLARGIDEDRRDSSAALEASFAQPVEEPAEGSDDRPAAARAGEDVGGDSQPAAAPAEAPETAPAPPAETPEPAERPAGAEAPAAAAAPLGEDVRTILLVDDEEDVRRVLGDRFGEGGYQVVEAEDPEAAVKKAGRLGKASIPFLLVTDLGMPTSGGASFQGGFEVVKRLSKMNLHPPVLMMTENLGPALRARARQMGIASFVFKPGLSKLDPPQFEADLRAFADKVLRDVLPGMGRARAPARPRRESHEAGPAPPAEPVSSEELSRQFQLLQTRLADLRGTADPTQVAALVMQVARESFERAVLFLVKNDEVRGLGGFGLAPREQTLNLLAREVVIPLSETSVFLDVVSKRRPFRGTLPEGKWSQYLLGRIGRFKSGSAAVLPLVAHRDAIALLYGDNPETGRDLGRLDALELFIHQAGLALENAFLQRKIQERQPAPS
jgi:CheY-like chemotaxis protein